jgi:hypothetical protein
MLINTSLPFLINNDCALGIAVSCYLVDVASASSPGKPATPDAKKKVKAHWQGILQYSMNFGQEVDQAFQFWDAVYKGMKVAGDQFEERKLFDEVDAWLAELR